MNRLGTFCFFNNHNLSFCVCVVVLVINAVVVVIAVVVTIVTDFVVVCVIVIIIIVISPEVSLQHPSVSSDRFSSTNSMRVRIEG